MKRIRTMAQLKRRSRDGGDFFILLNGGLRSSKRIEWHEEDKVFCVVKEIDDTVQELTEEQIMDREYTLIGEAMQKGALFDYEFG